MHKLIGTKLANYEIVARLGGGGMGEVFMAEDSRLGRKVALKLLAADVTGDTQRVQRFETEARSASALNHPNIVTIHDIGDAQAGRYIVMEMIEGETLRELCGVRVPVEQVSRIGEQAARALAVAHQAGLVHRDIKPENIMLRGDGYVKLVDFGLVRLVAPEPKFAEAETEAFDHALGGTPAGADAVTRSGTVIGTATYMSPEQARGEPVTSASDLFSLGIVLYELAVAQHPFAADSRVGVLNGIISGQPVRPARLNPEIPAALEGLMLDLLQKDSRLRPTAAEVVERLEGLALRTDDTQPRIEITKSRHYRVGRAAELARLQEALSTTEAGQGMLLCVTGEAGLGKTTLVDEFLDSVAAAEVPCWIARGRCSERLAGTEAYLPLIEALSSLVQGTDGGTIARAMKMLAPTWMVQISPPAADDSSGLRIEADAKIASQERMKRELAVLLEEITRTRPMIFFLDDLHWTDAASVDLLAYLATRFESTRVLILGTYRPADLLLADHPFAQVKLELQSRGLCREIELGFLGVSDIQQYLARRFPENKLGEDFAQLIHARTEGNALFMVDLVQYLCDQGVLAQKNGRMVLAEPMPDVRRDLPESMRSMIQRKLDQMSDQHRAILLAGSVQGDEFDAAIVARAMDVDELEVEESLEFLAGIHGVLRIIGEHEYPDGTLTVRCRFVHVLYQNALYGSLRPTRRAALSKAVAGALIELYGDQRGQIATQLAFLYEAGRDFKQASECFVEAARNAARIYANGEAVELASRAMAAAEKLRSEDQHAHVAAAAMERAQGYVSLSRFDDSHADFNRAEVAAKEIGDISGQVRAICGTATVLFSQRKLAEMRAAGEKAQQLGLSHGSDVDVAAAQVVFANERMCSGDLDAARQHFEEAIPVLDQHGTAHQLAEATSFYAMLHMWQLEYDRALEVSDHSLEKAREVGVGFLVLQTMFTRGIVQGNRGQITRAMQSLEEGIRLADLNGDAYWLPRLPNTLGWLYREVQDHEQAMRLDKESIALAGEMDMIEAQANANVNLGGALLNLDEPDAGLDHLREAERLYGLDVWYRWRYNIRMQAEFARYWIARGDMSLARSHAAAALSTAESTGANKYRAWAHKLMGDIAALEEHVDQAAAEYEIAIGITQRHRCPTIEWKLLAAAADLAKKRHQDERADELIAQARATVAKLADSVHDDRLRESFLASEAVRKL